MIRWQPRASLISRGIVFATIRRLKHAVDIVEPAVGAWHSAAENVAPHLTISTRDAGPECSSLRCPAAGCRWAVQSMSSGRGAPGTKPVIRQCHQKLPPRRLRRWLNVVFGCSSCVAYVKYDPSVTYQLTRAIRMGRSCYGVTGQKKVGDPRRDYQTIVDHGRLKVT